MRKTFQIIRARSIPAMLVLSLALFGMLLAQTIHVGFVYQQNTVQLAEMSSRLLRSTELAIDYAVITLGDVDLTGLARCTPDSVRAVRERVLQRGSIKEIELRDRTGALVCTGLGLRDELVKRSGNPSDTYLARNGTISLSTVDSEGNGLLRVSWQQGPALAVDAIINLDTIMFDVFPPALRENGEAVVRLAGGEVIARYESSNETGPGNNGASGDETEHFEISSSRYPVSSLLTVASPAIANWNAGSGLTALGLGGLLGGIIGIFLARLLFRPANPVSALRTAIQRREIQPYFQPIFSLADTATVGCEVLMRWVPANGAIILPNRFIPLAESSGLIAPMTEAIVRDALHLLEPLLSARPDFKIAFNVTPAHFMSDSFPITFRDIVAECGVSPHQVVIELTERQSFEHVEPAATVATEVRRLGFRLALDDMGTGHNGLSQVHSLPIDIIKIDKKFIDLIGIDQAATAIIQMIAKLASDLGKTTVAEGIETETQRLKLLQCGIDEGQGHLVSPPLSPQDFLVHVESAATRMKVDAKGVALSVA